MCSKIATDRFAHKAQSVPSELKEAEQWVLCDEHKVPLVPMVNGAVYAASSTDPTTWRSYETALAAFLDNEHFVGIGRVITADEEYVGVDLDDCLDEDGELSSWASRNLDRLGSYAETSPSMTGVKIWTKATGITRAYKKPGLEIYPKGRYFTVTGLVLGDPQPIREVGSELAAIIEEEFPKVNRSRAADYDGPERTLDLYELLERSGLEIFEEANDQNAERKYLIRCPWADEHSKSDVSGTRTGQYPNGALFFCCEHAHCARRKWREFRDYVNAIIHLGRPPRVAGGRLR